MASSKAVIMSNFKYTEKLVHEVNCGLTVDSTDINEIADAMKKLIQDPYTTKQMSKNGRKAVEETYNWGNMEKRLLKLYEGLT